ncbi:MAG: Rrf2 family transcriptional regulator [Flavobacteriales bacterium]|nr:Rrf2 family transcriptional regulator [Flavobacteriales bacterium]
MFSKTCEHGIKAVIYIAAQSLDGKRVKIGDVAENSGSPEAFTAKILSSLTKHNIVHSLTGPFGGFYIETEKMKTIKMSDIVQAIDGNTIYNGCGLGLSECDEEKPCPMHNKFFEIRESIKKMLTETDIYSLALNFKNGNTVLSR